MRGGCIVAHIAVLAGVGFTPFGGGLAEQGHFRISVSEA